MITVTPNAARQIRTAALEAEADDLALRIAARRDADGSLQYAMGFDDARESDLCLACEGVALVVAPGHRELLEGMTLDFVEIERGDFRFIFINPNEAGAGTTPDDSGSVTMAPGCGSGGCGCSAGGRG